MKPKIKYMFDYDCYPLWSIDDATIKQFGFNITDLRGLDLSDSTIKMIEYCCEMFDGQLNPIYPGFPSFWSGRMYAFFQYSIKHLLEKINKDIQEFYEIENHEVQRFNEEINIERIDIELKNFLSNPAQFAIKNGISFNSEKELKNEIQNSFNEWNKKEFKYYTI
ncbi:MAG: hypothetical protein KTR26_14130 [Flammeovirgaceae bacterium]|nr:hypothetical protein [Flammeovirgaceae bacterium]